MGCLIAILALITPRVVLVLLWLFTGYLHAAYANVSILWPILGFIFLPLTTLAYAFAINHGGGVDGIYLVLIIVAVVIDLGSTGGSAATRRKG